MPLDSADRGTEVHDELLGQIDDYLLPRLARLDAPLLVVLGGSTGAGKSTITNSLVGSDVSLAGVLRPSTRTPVLVCNSADRSWFLDGGVLPDLPRTTGERPTGAGLHLVVNDRVPAGLGLLDAPDIDSVELANHELAAQLLGAADAWLFVTTASRYADAVPWEYLRRARERSVAIDDRDQPHPDRGERRGRRTPRRHAPPERPRRHHGLHDRGGPDRRCGTGRP